MLSALQGWLRSQLSTWGVRQSGGITAGGWRGLYTSRGSEPLVGTELWGYGAWGDSKEEQLSLGAPNPLPQELSLSAGPGNVTGKPPSSGYVSY